MGEYYNWVNVDKKEYICPGDFGYGNKLHETMHKDSIPLHALHSLLIDDWKGDHILWFGDECSVSDQSSIDVIRTLYSQSKEFGYPGDAFDMICESYRNVSCLFKEAEKDVREPRRSNRPRQSCPSRHTPTDDRKRYLLYARRRI